MRKAFWATFAAWICCSAFLQAEVVSWSQSSFLVQESAGTGSLNIVLDSASGNSILVDYSVTNGTAIAGGLDVTLPSAGNILIPAGNTSASLSFGIIADNVIESLESLTVTLTGTSANTVTIGSTSVATLSIQDDDGSGNLEVFWAWGNRTNYESDVISAIPVYLSQPSTSTVSVNVLVTGSVNASDLSTMSSTLTFSPGETKAYFYPAFINDSVVESTETMILTLSSVSGGNVMSGKESLTYTILDDDDTPSIEVITGSGVITEGGSINVYFRLSHPTSQAVSFTVSDNVVTGTATNGTDYSFTSSTVTISAGSLETYKIITATRDGITEGYENFHVTISNPSNAVLGEVSSATIQIVDNMPEIYISNTNNIYEFNSSYTFSVYYWSGGSSSDNVVANLTLSGTATSGSDFTISSSTVIIPAGSTSGFVTVTLIDDNEIEATETLTATLTSAANAIIRPGYTSATMSILDNDTIPTVNISTSYSSVTEGSSARTIAYASLNRPYSGNVVVDLTYSGNATPGLDYSLSSGNAQLIITANSTSSSYVSLTPVDDSLIEGNEVVTATISSAANAIIGSSNTLSVTIVDNDGNNQEASLQMYSGSSSLSEASTSTSSFRAYINNISSQAITYVIAPVSGNATLGADYTISTNTLTIPAGQYYSSSYVTLTAVSDNLNETNETVTFGITSASNGIISSSNTITYTIIDDNDAPLVYFYYTSPSVYENTPSSYQYIYLDQVYSGNVTAVIETSGNAVMGTDYTLSSNTVTFTSGQTSNGIVVFLINNTIVDGTRNLIMTLSHVSNATTGSGNSLDLSIKDNDNPTIMMSSYSRAENSSSYQFYLYLDVASDLPVYGNVEVIGGTATLGSDYIYGAKTFSISSGFTNQIIDMVLVDDDIYELSETLQITIPQLVNAKLGTTVSTATIIDNDAEPTVEFSAYAYGSYTTNSINEGSNATLYFVMSAATSHDVYANYAVTGGTATRTLDYGMSANGLVRIPAGSTYGSISIRGVEDLLDEVNETVTIALGNVIGAQAKTSGNVFTLTIIDNDEPTGPAVSFYSSSSSVLGTAGNATIYVSLNMAVSTDVTFQVSVDSTGTTAVAGTDYTYSPSIGTITAGNTTASFSLSIINDSNIESSNYINFKLASVSGANIGAVDHHVLTISRANAVGQSGSHSINIPVYSKSTDYRMVGFPMINMTASKLLTKLSSAIGINSDYTWQLYAYDSKTSAGYQAVSTSSNVQTGQGFWMASLTQIDNSIAFAAPLSTDITNVNLNQGWNIIANPYFNSLPKGAFSIITAGNTYSLDGVQTETGSTLWSYNGSSGNTTYSSVDSLASGNAAWLYVWSGNIVTLKMNPNYVYPKPTPALSKTERSAPRQEPYPPSPPSSPAVSTSASGGGCLLKAADHQEVNR